MADITDIELDFEAPDIRIEEEDFALTLEYIGEGNDGDYDPEDDDDKPLWRFSVDQRLKPDEDNGFTRITEDNQWEALDNGSYCTQVPANCTPEEAQATARYLVEAIKCNGLGKRFLESLSWTTLSDVRKASLAPAE